MLHGTICPYLFLYPPNKRVLTVTLFPVSQIKRLRHKPEITCWSLSVKQSWNSKLSRFCALSHLHCVLHGSLSPTSPHVNPARSCVWEQLLTAHKFPKSNHIFTPISTFLHLKKNRDINFFPHWKEKSIPLPWRFRLCRAIYGSSKGARRTPCSHKSTEHNDSTEARF